MCHKFKAAGGTEQRQQKRGKKERKKEKMMSRVANERGEYNDEFEISDMGAGLYCWLFATI